MRLETFREIIARAIACFPEQRSRIERAATLVVLGHIEQTGHDQYAIHSESDPSVTYTVTARSCPCVDAQRHPDLTCNHGLCVDLMLVAEERERCLTARAAR